MMVRSGSAEHHIAHLDTLIARMAGLAEAQLAAASEALLRRDADAGRRIHAADRQLDDHERAIEAAARHLLLAQIPTSDELQEILGAIKIAGELERIGDYAANIARRVVVLANIQGLPRSGTLNRMARMVQDGLADVINAYTRRDVHRAIDVWERDRALDDLYSSLYREMLACMMEDPHNIAGYNHLLFIAKNLERIGDHAANIAEIIHLQITGTPLDMARARSENPDYVENRNRDHG